MHPAQIMLTLLVAAPVAAAPAETPMSLAAVRPLARETPLVAGGRPVALLLPVGEGYQAAGKRLVEGLAQRGIAAEVVTDVAAADPARRTVIGLGSMLNNPLLERLYWNRYTFVDAATPGPGRYLLHTVYDPYPYHGGHNIVVIGCSDAAGALPGVERFLALLQGGVLPYHVEAGPGAVAEAELAKIAAKPPDPTFLELLENANRYLQTGAEAYARKAIAALEIMAALYAPGGERQVCERGRRIEMPFPEEMASGEILAAWDAFEECPLLSDDQRLRFSRALLQFTRDLVAYVAGYDSIGRDDLVSWNHTTFPMLGLYFGGRYFHHYYGLADMPERLAKAKACFLAQARSWKPMEDADGYITYSPEHTMTYCLAEGNLEHFTRGNLQRYADYIIGICDSAGLLSGFGDSRLWNQATHPQQVLPLALWWSGDGGYRWLMDHYTRGDWRNPYERGGSAAQRPDRFLGVNVFPLDAQVYAYTQSRAYYNEPVTPSEVPLERAFDKISFRESWEPEAQYLILDGLARGKHLHYDGNAILTFVEAGQRWLLDHDYLTRNTTEHTMLSVLRRGRCDTLEPSLAALERWASLPGMGYTHTTVPGYNGCDWQRQILWRRGGYFLVADTVTPRTADHYDLELTWKTIDRDGRQRIVGSGDFVAERDDRPPTNDQRPTTRQQPDERRTTNDQRSTARQQPDGGRSSVVGRRSGAHLAIKPAYPVTAWVTNHVRAGITVPVSRLHQRQSGAFAAGVPVRFASLVYVSRPEKRRELRPVPLDTNLIAVQGSDPALALLGAVHSHGITATVAAGLVTPRELMLSGLRDFRAGELALASDAAVDLQLDLERGEITARAPEGGARVRVIHAGGERVVALAAGESRVRVPEWQTVPRAREVIARALATEAPAAAPRAAARTAAATVTPPVWEALGSGEGIAALKTADLADGKGMRLFVCRGKELLCLAPEGRVLWRFATGGRVRDVAFGELRPEPGHEIVVGAADNFLYLLAADGRLLEKREMRGTPWARSFGDRAFPLYNVGVWDINGDGKNEILVTLGNYDLQALDAEGKLLWKADHALHGSEQLSFADTDGDGRPDTIFVGDKYGSTIGVSPDGRRVHRGYASIGDVAYALLRGKGEKTPLVVTGSSTGDLAAMRLGLGSDVAWRFDNFGYGVNRLRAADLDGDGDDELLVASGSGYLYALDRDGKERWQDHTGRGVTDVLVTGTGREVRVAYCDEAGPIFVADGGGRRLAELHPPEPPRLMTLIEARGRRLLVVGLADGRVVSYPLP